MSNPTKAKATGVPTLREGLEIYVEAQRVAGKKDLRNTISVLLGTKNRIFGKAAAGPAYANSEFGGLPMNRLKAENFTSMFASRHKDLGAATRKRGMSATRGFIKHGISQRWLDSDCLAACFTVKAPAPADEWLRPEEVAAISSLVCAAHGFDDYDEFAYDTLQTTGCRAFEVVSLQRSALDLRTNVLTVIGKGPDEGKKRKIPVDERYAARWKQHVHDHAVRPNGHMLYRRTKVTRGGSNRALELRVDRTLPATAKALRGLCSRLQSVAELELDLSDRPSFTLTPKVFRRTFACTQLILHRLGLGGLDLYSLQRALGHESLETTQVYLADVNEYLGEIDRPVSTVVGAALILEEISRRAISEQ